MLDSTIKYTYKDICIIPCVRSNIISRNECNPFKNNYLPIFTSPMDTVVDLDAINIYKKNYINPILPRTIDINTRIKYLRLGNWVAFSFKEFIEFFKKFTEDYIPHILIDMANGHMSILISEVQKIKKQYGNNVCIMIGNIANPKTYQEFADIGIDYIRLSIGTGNACTTSTNTGIHYPIASLIYDTWLEKKYMQDTGKETLPQIIADGGIRSYADVIKALALGADYVMIGSVFAGLQDTPGNIIEKDGIKYKEYYGMSSEKGNLALGHIRENGFEGIIKYIPITGNLQSWSTNMTSYIKSAMSYCGIKDIKYFDALHVKTSIMSVNASSVINSPV